MYSPDYAKEIGLGAAARIVPLKIALPMFVAILGGAWFGFVAPDIAARSAKATDKNSAAGPAGPSVASH